VEVSTSTHPRAEGVFPDPTGEVAYPDPMGEVWVVFPGPIRAGAVVVFPGPVRAVAVVVVLAAEVDASK